ncbi:general transcription factor 3C polypeptide 1 isoform X2 [Calliopsis andreniformis]|uniref:general transcription factor 3C polypeptide 1 isoform X2 n=1 Tax=Calliopsis andreniformis TaxID=337506 RepID=UPI003FCD1A40
MVSYPSINVVELVIDEVALEGLDGITIEALWLRLTHRLHNSLPLPNSVMIQIWSICIQIKEFAFYELENAREPLTIFDRYEFVDPDLGIILEPENVPLDIYPHFPIHDVPNGIKGSCSTYYTRKDVTEIVRNLNLDDARNRYGQKLVIVASQSARNSALMGDEVSPTLELNVTQYCFLERVGRSRYHGEVTQGKLSLNALKEDPKSLFYHRKLLLRHKLITKQIHHQKSGDHSCNGSLLHLPRFFVERKPKAIFLAEEVVKILKTKPNCVAEYDEIKRKLQIEHAIKKLFKTSFFQKVVKTDIRIPYRTLYPNAKPTEWQQKTNPAKEKKIKVVQLLFPTIDIVDAWSKDDIPEEDEPQELNISNHKFGVPYLKQANTIIEVSGNDGACQTSLAKEMGLTKLQSRTVLRNIVKTGIVATYMNDIGRQRLTKYVSKKFENGSILSKQFKEEIHKIKELTQQIPTEINNVDKSATTMIEENEQTHTNDQWKNVRKLIQSDVISKSNRNDDFQTEKNICTSIIKLQKKFYVVNRILYKYHLIKHPNRYKCTFSKFQLSRDNKVETSKNIDVNNVLSRFSELSKTGEITAAYKNIKVDLTISKPICTEKSEADVFGFMENVQNSGKKNITNITYRLLRRANMIIQSVQENQVIDDMTKLMKMIHEEEDKEGYDVKIDKKSLLRLLQKLAKDNLVKNIKITLRGNGREKHLTFICDPNINIDSAVIQSAVEQAKLKFYLLSSQKSKSITKKYVEKLDYDKSTNADDKTINLEDKSSLKQLKTLPSNCKCGPKESKKYGYSPKFIRMQALHFFLFYLVYEHPGEQTLSKDKQIRILRNNDFKITDKLAEEFSTVYTKEISWKMFVPPLPKYNGWPQGWTLMCDILLRLPLSVFLKIHFVSFAIPELDGYIKHPIRKHYLVRDLPNDIRNSLLYSRKYIFNIHETATRLCYIGLIQFGPQRLKEKDQVFIYVNRNAELMDTTSSTPSYHIIEDKPYPILKYKFDGMHTVEKYWYDMWNICISTPLGGRLVVQGKEIVLEDLNKKSTMIQAVVARSPEEAVELDVGYIPGDRKGAAGIDSACFAHLKRNWNWGFGSSTRQIKNQQNVIYERDVYLSKIKAKPIKFTEFSGLKRVSGPLSVNATELRKKVQTKHEEYLNQQKKYEALTCCQSTKQKSYVRRVLPRKCSSKKRTKYDEIDYRALQRMHKLRVDWNSYEDKILLICKVAMMYLCPNPRKQVITFSAVRDILRTYSRNSYNKTSKACQRRLLYILRQQHNVNAVALGVEEVKQNFYIKKRFDGIVEKFKEEYKSFNEYEKQIVEAFNSLVAYIAKKYYDISDVGAKEPLPVPITAQEFNIFYKVMHPDKPFGNRGFTKDVRNVNDIYFAVINSVIHSSMCCGKDRRSWIYQLFKVYQQYPEILLRNAMAKIRSDQMVTIKKNQLTTIKKYGNYMPMSSSQYQLSSNYIYKFHTKWPYDIFKESYDVFFKLVTWYSRSQGKDQSKRLNYFDGIEMLPITGGIIGAIHDYIIRDQIDFDVEIPDQIIMLDPRLKEKDETYFRIAKRYQNVLAILDNLKSAKESCFQNNDTTCDHIKNNDKCFSSDVDVFININTHMDNVGTKVDKINSPDLDTEKSISLQNYKSNGKFFENTNNVTNYENLSDDTGNKNDCNDLAINMKKKETLGDRSNFIPNNETEIRNTKVDLVSNLNTQTKTIDSHGKSRSRNYNEDLLDLDGPTQKRVKREGEILGFMKNNEETETPSLIINSSVSTELLNQTQSENLKTHSIDGTDENDDAKVTNSMETDNEEIILNQESEITTSLKEHHEQHHKQVFTRVSDILKNIPPTQSYLNQCCKVDDSVDAHKRYTRIALLRMREELSELTVADSHHAHEYFVVNMFKVFYSLYTSNLQNSEKDEIFRGLSIASELLPLKLNIAHNLIQEISKFAVFPKDDILYIDFKQNLSQNLAFTLHDVDAVYEFIRNKMELGASVQELTVEFGSSLRENLHNIVSLLTNQRLLLRSGVTIARYIHHYYVDPWLIHSCKINRLERESVISVSKGNVYNVTEPEILINKDGGTNIVEVSNASSSFTSENKLSNILDENLTDLNPQSRRSEKNENADKDKLNDSREEYNTQPKARIQRKRTRLLLQKDMPKSAKQFDSITKQEIRVVMKPWIRIDGVLNRRVLDRMMGAVLSYCLTHPGIALTKVQNRFVPALQPYHTRELIEMLVKLGCLEHIILQRTHTTLLSKPSQIKPRSL